MEKLIEYFTSNIDKGLWTGFLTLAVYFVLKKEPFKLITYYTDRKDKHYDFATNLLSGDKITNEAKQFLVESLEKGAFFRYYGIHADAQMRSSLLELHKNHEQEITWTQIRRAYAYMHLIQGRVAIKFGWYDRPLRWIVTTICIMSASYSILAITVAVSISGKSNSSQFFALTGLSLLLLIATMYFASFNWPYQAARKIDKSIRESNR